MHGVSNDDTPTADRNGISLPNTEKLIEQQIRAKAPRAAGTERGLFDLLVSLICVKGLLPAKD